MNIERVKFASPPDNQGLLSGNGIIKFKEINGKLRNKETGKNITGNSLLGSSMIPIFEEEAKSEIIR